LVCACLGVGAVAGCLSSGSNEPDGTPTPFPTAEGTPSPTPARNPDREEWPSFESEPPSLDPAYPETDSEIRSARDEMIAQYYDQIGNPQTDESIRIASLEELSEYASKDDVHVKMEPGTYHITLDNYTDLLGINYDVRRSADANVGGQWGPNAYLLKFGGYRSYYDLRDVTITYETRLLNVFPDGLTGWKESYGKPPLEVCIVTGDQSIIRGMNVRPVHKPEQWAERTYPVRSARTLTLWEPHRTMLQDVSIQTKGSIPYGYGRLLGKGGNAVTRLRKHSASQLGGRDNLIVGLDLQSGSYGHLCMVSPYRYYYIDSTFSGEMRRSDEMLAETEGPLAELDYETKYGKLEPGMMVSLQEGGLRTYHNLQEEHKLLTTTISKSDGGTGLVNGSAPVFMSNCRFIKNGTKDISISSGSTVRNGQADVRYSPALQLGGKHAPDGDPENIEIDLELLPSPTEGIQQQYAHFHPTAGAKLKFQGALIAGDGHDITLRKAEDDLQLSEPRPIVIGSHWFSKGGPDLSVGGATDVTLENRTGQPTILRETAENCTVTTSGPVEDRGENNTINVADW
jgi:hypothetical protein